MPLRITADRRRRSFIRIGRAFLMLPIAMLFIAAPRAEGQCNVQANLTQRGDPRGAGIAVSVFGGNAGHTMTFELFCLALGGFPCSTQQRITTDSRIDYFHPLQCSLTGNIAWRVEGSCESIGPGGESDAINQTVQGGPHQLKSVPYQLEAKIVDPPSPSGNVRLNYEFHEEAGSLRQVLVDGGLRRTESGYSGSLDVSLPPGPHTATLKWCVHPSVGGGQEHSVDFVVPQQQPEEKLFVRIMPRTRGSTPFTVEQRVSPSVQAQLPLGTVFDVAIVKKQGELEPVLAVTSIYSERNEAPDLIPANVPADIRSAVLGRRVPPLFSKDTLLAFGKDDPAQARTYLAEHLGTVQVVIVPLLADAPTINLDITVIEPDTLGPRPSTIGDRRYAYDTHIIRWANITGYPPQLLKAQADWESVRRFDPRQYRYEPLTTDWDNFSTSSGKLVQNKYAPYRLATCPAQGNLAEGTRLMRPADTEFRSRYEIDANRQPCPAAVTTNPATFRAIAEADDRVTAYEIYIANDVRRRQNWFKILSTKWKRDAINRDAPGALGFTAQTAMAASYGVMQVLWTTAIENDENNFRVGYVERNPSYLSDEADNLDGGWSSLIVGAMFMKRKAQEQFRLQPPDRASEDTFIESFRVPVKRYNGDPAYPNRVFGLVGNWYPISAKDIFP